MKRVSSLSNLLVIVVLMIAAIPHSFAQAPATSDPLQITTIQYHYDLEPSTSRIDLEGRSIDPSRSVYLYVGVNRVPVTADNVRAIFIYLTPATATLDPSSEMPYRVLTFGASTQIDATTFRIDLTPGDLQSLQSLGTSLRLSTYTSPVSQPPAAFVGGGDEALQAGSAVQFFLGAPGTVPGATGTSAIATTTSATSRPATCQKSSLSGADVKDIYKNIYYPSHQTTGMLGVPTDENVASALGQSAGEQKADVFNNIFPSMDEAVKSRTTLSKDAINAASEAELKQMAKERSLPVEGKDEEELRQDMQEYLSKYGDKDFKTHQPIPGSSKGDNSGISFDFDGCRPCDEFPIQSASDVYQFACIKSESTQIQFCQDGVGECQEPISEKSKLSEAGEEILEAIGKGSDLLLSVGDMKFNEVNGYWQPTQYSTLLYSDMQKRYNNLLPYAMVAGFFMPGLGEYTQIARKADAWLSDSWLGKSIYKNVLGKSSVEIDELVALKNLKYASNGKLSDLTTLSTKQRNELLGDITTAGHKNVYLADSLLNDAPAVDDLATKVVAARSKVTTDVKDAVGRFLTAEDTQLLDLSLRETGQLKHDIVLKAMDTMEEQAKQGSGAAASALKNVRAEYSAYLTSELEENAIKRGLVEALAKNGPDDVIRVLPDGTAVTVADEAINILKDPKLFGLKGTSDVSKILAGGDNAENFVRDRVLARLTTADAKPEKELVDQIVDSIIQYTDDPDKLLKSKNFQLYFSDIPGLDDMIPATGMSDAALSRAATLRTELSTQITSEISRFTRLSDDMYAAMARAGDLTAAQEGALKKIGRMLSGTTTTTKQAIGRALFKEVGVYATALSIPSRSSNQLVLEVSAKAKDKQLIDAYLDGEAPYLLVLSNEPSFSGGWENILYMLGKIPVIPAIAQWMTAMQWRWGGGTRGSELPPAPELQCQNDGNAVKDTIWVFGKFTQEEKKRLIYYGSPMKVLLSGNSMVIDSSSKNEKATTDIYVTEKENLKDGCLPTIIVKSHGLDIQSQIWKSKGLAGETIADFMNSLMGKGSPSGETDFLADGLTFEKYVATPEDDRCAVFDIGNLKHSIGAALAVELIPLLDIVAAPWYSYWITECEDTDFWIHFVPNEAQSGLDIALPELDFGAQEQPASPTAVLPTDTEVTTPTAPTGAVVVASIEAPTREGVALSGASTPTGMQTTGDTATAESDEDVDLEGEKSLFQQFLASIGVTSDADATLEELGVIVKEKLEEASIESKLKAANAKTLWLHGEHPLGVYGGLEVKTCCFITLSGNAEFKSTGYEDAKAVGMVSQSKPKSNVPAQTLVIDPETNSITMKQVDPATGQLRDTMKIENGLSTHMYRGDVENGRIIPNEGQIATYAESDGVLFKLETFPTRDFAPLRVGDYGSNTDVTSIVNCLVDYINNRLLKRYAYADYDNALEELGDIIGVQLDNGVYIKRDFDTFIVTGPDVLNPASEVEVRLNEEVYADGVLVGKIKVIDTTNAQLMWDRDGNRIMMWIHTLGEAEPTAFAPGQDSDQDGLSDEQEAALGTDSTDADSDNDGVSDGQEIANGTDPLNPDTDGDGTIDGQEDSNGDGIPDAQECNFNGLAIDLGANLAEYLTLIGPILSFETNQTQITFIAEVDKAGICRKYVRMCDRVTGECAAPEELSDYTVQGSIIEIRTTDNHRKLLELSVGLNGQPMLKSTHFDDSGKVVEGIETFDAQPVEKLRGSNGIAVYDPDTGTWKVYDGFDIPMDPRFGSGTTITNTVNGPSALPYNPYDRPVEEAKELGTTLAELPWAPPSALMLSLFVTFLLMAALLIRKKIYKEGSGKELQERGKDGP